MSAVSGRRLTQRFPLRASLWPVWQPLNVVANVERPLLLLDVDGVLLPVRDNEVPGDYYQASADFQGVTVEHWDSGETHWIWICAANVDRLRRLREMGWATGWNEHANEIIAPLHELPNLPVIKLAWSEGLRALKISWKLPVITDYVKDRACVLIDDHIRDDVEQWARARRAPTLLLRADHRVGLTDDIVDRALAFAAHADPSQHAE